MVNEKCDWKIFGIVISFKFGYCYFLFSILILLVINFLEFELKDKYFLLDENKNIVIVGVCCLFVKMVFKIVIRLILLFL